MIERNTITIVACPKCGFNYQKTKDGCKCPSCGYETQAQQPVVVTK